MDSSDWFILEAMPVLFTTLYFLRNVLYALFHESVELQCFLKDHNQAYMDVSASILF